MTSHEHPTRVDPTSDDYLIGDTTTTSPIGAGAPMLGPDGTPVPCRICGAPLSQPRIDYGRTTCRHHYRLEPKASTP